MIRNFLARSIDDAAELLPGGNDQGQAEYGLGRVRLRSVEDPPIFVMTARGYIGPHLVREVLTLAETFARQHAGGWYYVADVRRAIPSPRNFSYLQRFHSLPALRVYFAVAPFYGRFFLRLTQRVAPNLTPDAVYKTLAGALAQCKNSARFPGHN